MTFRHFSILLIILLSFSFVTLVFFWSFIRPFEIKEDCYYSATDEARNLLKIKSEFDPKYKAFLDQELYLNDDYERAYRRCLEKNGLN